MGPLAGKRAVVTAAGQGIGAAIARRFSEDGAEVFASDLDPVLMSDLNAQRTDKLDVTDDAAVEAYAAKVGDVDVLCNVAGFVHNGTVLDATNEDWDFSFNLNVKSMHRMIRAFLPGMLARGTADIGGSIINMSSGASSIKGAPSRYIYGATKAAVIGLTKAVAADFAGQKLRCNAICPGTVDSPSWRDRVEAIADEVGGVDAAEAQFVARQPMGRVASADEIAAMAVYLASDESAFVTGAEFKIDGGWTI
ncbi:2-keto-3-deoxy-L-fuconate dehydrogenase [Cognatiyoonia sediminum]|uniref:2-keto-3-deoxy-L-fuconate dehydrogenase n=1 Tax=Cognatiyoonia sediminum TaxID=1508389 RepID=A0A1M5T6C2_9RHOB|nr:SDR family oxidoreductase [Cognatiyoonia sediminum]SHH46301.1 2-keto-3-deoxy-L-fuconate dehydrogenase [Cognatiyoonia sediminum]